MKCLNLKELYYLNNTYLKEVWLNKLKMFLDENEKIDIEFNLSDYIYESSCDITSILKLNITNHYIIDKIDLSLFSDRHTIYLKPKDLVKTKLPLFFSLRNQELKLFINFLQEKQQKEFQIINYLNEIKDVYYHLKIIKPLFLVKNTGYLGFNNKKPLLFIDIKNNKQFLKQTDKPNFNELINDLNLAFLQNDENYFYEVLNQFSNDENTISNKYLNDNNLNTYLEFFYLTDIEIFKNIEKYGNFEEINFFKNKENLIKSRNN